MNKQTQLTIINDHWKTARLEILQTISGRKTEDARTLRDFIQSSWDSWRRCKRAFKRGDDTIAIQRLDEFVTGIYRIKSIYTGGILKPVTDEIDVIQNAVTANKPACSHITHDTPKSHVPEPAGDFDGLISVSVNEAKIKELMDTFTMIVEPLDTSHRAPANRQSGYQVVFKDACNQSVYILEHYYHPHHAGLSGMRIFEVIND